MHDSFISFDLILNKIITNPQVLVFTNNRCLSHLIKRVSQLVKNKSWVMDCVTPTSDDTEEEILIYAEFEDTVNIENYRSIHVLGIQAKNPIIQLDDTIFTGQLESALGTHMFFGKDPAPHSVDPLFDKLPKESVKYVCKAKKYLRMKHTYITPKNGADADSQSHPQEAVDNIVPLNFNTVQEAIDVFKSEWQSKVEANNFKMTSSDSPSCDQDMEDINLRS